MCALQVPNSVVQSEFLADFDADPQAYEENYSKFIYKSLKPVGKTKMAVNNPEEESEIIDAQAELSPRSKVLASLPDL